MIILNTEEAPVVIPTDPCVPSPCGPNAQCKVIRDSPSCSCLPEFIGIPPRCKPECVSNSECPNHLACIKQKCKDPCPGTCGVNSECHVISHTPNCVCIIGYIGDPFIQCILPPSKLVSIMYKIARQSLINKNHTQSLFYANTNIILRNTHAL